MVMFVRFMAWHRHGTQAAAKYAALANKLDGAKQNQPGDEIIGIMKTLKSLLVADKDLALQAVQQAWEMTAKIKSGTQKVKNPILKQAPKICPSKGGKGLKLQVETEGGAKKLLPVHRIQARKEGTLEELETHLKRFEKVRSGPSRPSTPHSECRRTRRRRGGRS